eukprot:354861-Chlamydomonas_euryale.AAC.1
MAQIQLCTADASCALSHACAPAPWADPPHALHLPPSTPCLPSFICSTRSAVQSSAGHLPMHLVAARHSLLHAQDLLQEVDTHLAPSYTIHPKLKDNYPAYNKPEAVIHWLDNTKPTEDWVLVLDSDMLLRRPFLVEQMGPERGLALGARYSYMVGVANELATRHVPDV